MIEPFIVCVLTLTMWMASQPPEALGGPLRSSLPITAKWMTPLFWDGYSAWPWTDVVEVTGDGVWDSATCATSAPAPQISAVPTASAAVRRRRVTGRRRAWRGPPGRPGAGSDRASDRA